MLAERPRDKELPRGLDAVWNGAAAILNRLAPRRRRFLHRAGRIVALEREFRDRAGSHLREDAEALRDLFRCGRETPHDLDRAFALLREVAFREVGERPFPVQVAGALAIDAGCPVQQLDYDKLRARLVADKQVLDWTGPRAP